VVVESEGPRGARGRAPYRGKVCCLATVVVCVSSWQNPVQAQVAAGASLPTTTSPLIQVHLKADSAAVRIEHHTESGAWVPICSAPCSRMLFRSDQYVIGGFGVPSSRIFVLPDDRQEVTLTVRAGSSPVHLIGGAAVAAGAIATVIGLGVGYYALPDSSGPSERDKTIGRYWISGGLGAIVLGIVFLNTWHTNVMSSSGIQF
jgi:hypothetical protein